MGRASRLALTGIRRSMTHALASGYRVIEQIEALGLCMGAPGRVLVGKQRLVERGEQMVALPAIEVGCSREHHPREKGECAQLRACTKPGGNQVWLFDIATGDGLEILSGAAGEHFHVVRRRTDSVGTACDLLHVVTNVRELEWRHPAGRRRFGELLHRAWDVTDPSTQRLPHGGGGIVW